jgi:hypothetical protein
MADDDDRQDDTFIQNFHYGSNIRFTDDPLPRDVRQTVPPDHPVTDSASNLDDMEIYDEGIDGATEAEDPLKK